MKNLMKFLAILFCCINLTSCSNDTQTPIVVDPPVVVDPPIVVGPPVVVLPPNVPIQTKLPLKPAVFNVLSTFSGKKTSSTNGKTSATTKHLVKTITFIRNTPFDKLYKTKFTEAEYGALPTDNIYDPTEEALNANTRKNAEQIYTYSASGNLEMITTNNIAYPERNGTLAYAPITFDYNEAGVRAQITKYQNAGTVMTYEYNAIGQITKAFSIEGNLLYSFAYDEYNNISNKYLYHNNLPQMRYTYVYYANNTYEKNWIVVNQDGTETKTSTVKYVYDGLAPGVYNNEAIYKILMDNREGLQYLHVISNDSGYKPKYFYDTDGYLLKYDRSGQGNAEDITLFIYE